MGLDLKYHLKTLPLTPQYDVIHLPRLNSPVELNRASCAGSAPTGARPLWPIGCASSEAGERKMLSKPYSCPLVWLKLNSSLKIKKLSFIGKTIKMTEEKEAPLGF
jgi:hypothetical protein